MRNRDWLDGVTRLLLGDRRGNRGSRRTSGRRDADLMLSDQGQVEVSADAYGPALSAEQHAIQPSSPASPAYSTRPVVREMTMARELLSTPRSLGNSR